MQIENLMQKYPEFREYCEEKNIEAIGYTEKDFDNKNWYIRLEAYRLLGYTEKSFNDEYWEIRLEAYQALGFTPEAFDDPDPYIRNEAYEYFYQKLSAESQLLEDQHDIKILGEDR